MENTDRKDKGVAIVDSRGWTWRVMVRGEVDCCHVESSVDRAWDGAILVAQALSSTTIDKLSCLPASFL